jgi:hypothetical protein
MSDHMLCKGQEHSVMASNREWSGQTSVRIGMSSLSPNIASSGLCSFWLATVNRDEWYYQVWPTKQSGLTSLPYFCLLGVASYRSLRYNPKGCGFEIWVCIWSSSLKYSFRSYCYRGWTQRLREMSTRNFFRGVKWGRCQGLRTLLPLRADNVKILEISTTWRPRGLTIPVLGKLYLLSI